MGKPENQRGAQSRAQARLDAVAPAVIVMVAVTAYPIVYAIYLSLQKDDLRFPDQKEFVGLANYGDVLSSTTWWKDFFNTLIITVVSVGIELVLGMVIALVMHRAIFGRGPVRDDDPDPVRHRDRGRGVRLAVRVRPDQRLRRPSCRCSSDTAEPFEPRAGSFLRHHPGRDLEDDAVHGAAAAGRAGAGARRAARGGKVDGAGTRGSASSGSRCRS